MACGLHLRFLKLLFGKYAEHTAFLQFRVIAGVALMLVNSDVDGEKARFENGKKFLDAPFSFLTTQWEKSSQRSHSILLGWPYFIQSICYVCSDWKIWSLKHVTIVLISGFRTLLRTPSLLLKQKGISVLTTEFAGVE